MRKSGKLLLSFLLLCSCTTPVKQKPVFQPDSTLWSGVWKLDSCSREHCYDENLFITSDHHIYLFSENGGDHLAASGQLKGNDSLTTTWGIPWAIHLTDSHHLVITQPEFADPLYNYFSRYDAKDDPQPLEERLKADSLRQKALGWWKLVPPVMPVRLINYPGYFFRLTLSIREGGNADYYLNNKLDSVVTYSYNIYPDAISFQLNCVSSRCPLSFGADGSMHLVLDKSLHDTLRFRRLTEIDDGFQ